jgi:signal transduction histidine kinase
MLCNLIGNAIQYSPPETEVRCTIEQERETDGSCLMCCRIADQGEGIAPANLETIFQPFRRSSPSPGVGLGLAFVKTVAARHGGTVEVSSQVGVGTTFTVRIPVAPDV